jgi:hypothetical protein
MAKKVKIDVEVKGKGTKKVEIDAKKAGAALDKTSKSAKSADRNIKGVAGASSGASKNFSKMSQGMTGGIVPAYAVLAANIFAIGAAFRFLKGQADLSNLEASQIQFAQNTGVALSSMTARLREASGGMLGFKEAGQATAIGLAQGFSGSQMQKLTEGARKASIALGRDFEDSFDRLVRGASKAEPELLDELGIVLRLETATKNYAAAIGKQVTALTAAERSQAVLIETQKQLDEKYGAIEADNNPFTVLKTTFDDLVMKITQFFLPALEAVATFIATNAKAALVVFGLVGFSILKAMIPIDSWSTKLKDWGEGHKKEMGAAIADIKKYKNEMKGAEAAIKQRSAGASIKVQRGASQAIAAGGGSQALKAAAAGNMTKAQVKQLKQQISGAQEQMKKFGKVTRGTFKGVGKSIINDLSNNMKIMGQTSEGAGRKIKRWLGLGIKSAKIGLKSLKVVASNVFKGMAAGARMVGKAMGAMMKGAVIFAVLQQIYNLFIKISEAPFTIVMNIKNMIINIVTFYQFLFNTIMGGVHTLIQKFQGMVNKIINMIPDWFMSKETRDSLTMDTTETYKPSTFAADLDAWLEEKIAANETLAEWKKREDAIEANNIWEAKLNDIREYGIGVREELERINVGIEGRTKQIDQISIDIGPSQSRGLTAEEQAMVKRISADRTMQIYQGIQTIDIAGGMGNLAGLKGSKRETAIQNMLTEFGSEIERLSPAMLEALKSGDVESAAAIQESARSYVAERNSLREQLNDFASKIKGDTFDKESWLNELIKAKDSAMATAAKDSLDSDAAAMLDAAFESYGGAEVYRASLAGIREEALKIAVAQNEVSMAMQNTQFLPPGLKARQMEILNIEKERLTIAELHRKVKEDEQNLVGMGADAPERNRAQAALDADIAAIAVAENKLALIRKAGTDTQKMLNVVGNSVESNLISNINQVVEGTKSIKQGFADMAIGVLKSLSQIITKLMVMKALEATGISMFNPVGAKTGGVFSAGQEVTGYARGGIASGSKAGYPATLHGTEAVVPLSGGRSIPVNMTGGANNIVINISGDGAPQTQGGDSEGLGKAIARAVQSELQNQKRSGGILSPYGVA